MSSREVIQALQKTAGAKSTMRAAHKQFKHPTKRGRVTVPHPKRDIPIGTLKSIEKLAGFRLT